MEVNRAKCELILGVAIETMDVPEVGIKILARIERFLLGSDLNDPSTQKLELEILPSNYVIPPQNSCTYSGQHRVSTTTCC